MTEDEAAAEATRRNLALGCKDDGVSFFIEVERDDGTWDVERREQRSGLVDRLLNAPPFTS